MPNEEPQARRETVDEQNDRLWRENLAETEAIGWPKGVGRITMGGLGRVGIDDKGGLYFDGKPLVTKHELGRREFLLASIAAWSTATAALLAAGVFTIELGRSAGWWGG